MLILLRNAIADVEKAYNEYRFADVVSTLTNLMTNDLSAYYMDYTKDILYCNDVNDRSRRVVQTVLYTAVEVLAKLWAPILPHTMEEVNDYMKWNAESIHLEDFPVLNLDFDTEAIEKDMQVLFDLRKKVLKALEDARSEGMIGKALEARVTLHVDQETEATMRRILDNPAQWFIVSQVVLTDQGEEVSVSKAEGHVCPRCWNVTTAENEDSLCDRCEAVMHHC